jgi:hypothetical protein
MDRRNDHRPDEHAPDGPRPAGRVAGLCAGVRAVGDRVRGELLYLLDHLERASDTRTVSWEDPARRGTRTRSLPVQRTRSSASPDRSTAGSPDPAGNAVSIRGNSQNSATSSAARPHTPTITAWAASPPVMS